jgi:hypothetical protein
MVQVLAMSTGRKLRPIAAPVVDQFVKAMNSNPDAVDQPRKHLEALKRLLDAESPGYKD